LFSAGRVRREIIAAGLVQGASGTDHELIKASGRS
jgi:hypothetical protein